MRIQREFYILDHAFNFLLILIFCSCLYCCKITNLRIRLIYAKFVIHLIQMPRKILEKVKLNRNDTIESRLLPMTLLVTFCLKNFLFIIIKKRPQFSKLSLEFGRSFIKFSNQVLVFFELYLFFFG